MFVPYTTPQLHDPSQPPPAPGRTQVQPDYPHIRAQGTSEPEAKGKGKNAFNTERPLDVAPAPEGRSILITTTHLSELVTGGVAVGGQPDLPEGHASMGDKIVGKAQKVIGKYTNNPELHEKGELRETGGKAAAEGRARAAHD
ncbi:hypothetical protein JVU11DRAFT_8729 [Chiua virens]|nr:hypothetical protein JVU11DRAFT_8729 [Chiua virens]